MNKVVMICSVLLCACLYSSAQTIFYNLADLLKKDQLIIDTSNKVTTLNDGNYANAILLKKIAWLKDVSFASGTINIDLRGKVFFSKLFRHFISCEWQQSLRTYLFPSF